MTANGENVTARKGTLTPLGERVDAVMWADKPSEYVAIVDVIARRLHIEDSVGWWGPGTTWRTLDRVGREKYRVVARRIISDLGLRKADPFGSGHGLHCWSRSGGKCDCTAADETYFTLAHFGRTGRGQ